MVLNSSKTCEIIAKRWAECLEESYNISLLIAKTGKPRTIGEKIILPAIQEVVTTVMHANGRSVIQSIPLSNDTLQGE